ncbi:hypothetical protein M422DRAFT_195438, partial [Sphaerobolus stellatus SS14]
RIGLTYDVACQYTINIKDRWQEHFPELLETVERMIAGVAKMHQVGHKDDCAYSWALKFLIGAGRTSGELIETVWAELNQANGSVKQMNPGMRHDALNLFYGDWNFRKMVSLSKTYIDPSAG